MTFMFAKSFESLVPAAAGAVLLAALAASPALAEKVEMRFGVDIGGMNAMSLSFTGDMKRDSYSGRASLAPRGFAKMFIKKSFDLSVSGRFNGDRALPSRFSMVIRKKGRRKTATVRWPGGRPVWERTPPHGAGERRAIARALRGRVLDPLSMLFHFARAKGTDFCKGRVRIFDGHDVYDIVARKLGSRNARTAVYRGPVLLCQLTYVPVAGQSEKKRRRRLADPPVYTTWLARVKSATVGSLYVPVRVDGRFDGRNFSARPKKALLGGRPLRPAGG